MRYGFRVHEWNLALFLPPKYIAARSNTRQHKPMPIRPVSAKKDRRTHEEIDRGARDLDAAVPVPVPAFGSKSNYYDVH